MGSALRYGLVTIAKVGGGFKSLTLANVFLCSLTACGLLSVDLWGTVCLSPLLPFSSSSPWLFLRLQVLLCCHLVTLTAEGSKNCPGALTQRSQVMGAREAWAQRWSPCFFLTVQLWLLTIPGLLSWDRAWCAHRTPLRDLNGKGGITPLPCVCILFYPAPLTLSHPLPPDGNLWPERGTAFLFVFQRPSWSITVEGNFSYKMTETLWSETSRQFFNLKVLSQFDTEIGKDEKHHFNISKTLIWSVTSLWVTCNPN